MDVSLELTLWRWSTAVQISSSLMIALFFVVFARSVRTAEVRAWRSAWLWNLAALATTVVFWLFTPIGHRGRCGARLLPRQQGDVRRRAAPGGMGCGATRCPVSRRAILALGGGGFRSHRWRPPDLHPAHGDWWEFGDGAAPVTGAFLALRQSVAGFRWLALGLLVRGGVAVIEGIAYFQQLQSTAPAGGLLSVAHRAFSLDLVVLRRRRGVAARARLCPREHAPYAARGGVDQPRPARCADQPARARRPGSPHRAPESPRDAGRAAPRPADSVRRSPSSISTISSGSTTSTDTPSATRRWSASPRHFVSRSAPTTRWCALRAMSSCWWRRDSRATRSARASTPCVPCSSGEGAAPTCASRSASRRSNRASNPEEAFRAADRRMYEAKSGERPSARADGAQAPKTDDHAAAASCTRSPHAEEIAHLHEEAVVLPLHPLEAERASSVEVLP